MKAFPHRHPSTRCDNEYRHCRLSRYGTDEGILLKNADIAIYQAKQAGRARYRIYNNT